MDTLSYKIKYVLVASVLIIALLFETTIELAEDLTILVFQVPFVLFFLIKPMFQILINSKWKMISLTALFRRLCRKFQSVLWKIKIKYWVRLTDWL